MRSPESPAPMVVAAVLCLAILAAEGGGSVRPAQIPEAQAFKTVAVPAEAGWIDTGIDVAQGEAWGFRASGRITLQRGNPAADCGPEGLEFMTVQQPLQDLNIGALIGKVAQLISVRVDEDTGEEIRDEIVSLFPIGAEREVRAPIRGRLYLGVNESVVEDNGGAFEVTIFRRWDPPGPAGAVTSR